MRACTVCRCRTSQTPCNYKRTIVKKKKTVHRRALLCIDRHTYFAIVRSCTYVNIIENESVTSPSTFRVNLSGNVPCMMYDVFTGTQD